MIERAVQFFGQQPDLRFLEQAEVIAADFAEIDSTRGNPPPNGIRIVETAYELFSQDGVRAVGVDRIIDYIDYTATPIADGQKFDVVLNLVSTSPEQTAAFLKEERVRWEAAIKAAGITKGQFE